MTALYLHFVLCCADGGEGKVHGVVNVGEGKGIGGGEGGEGRGGGEIEEEGGGEEVGVAC